MDSTFGTYITDTLKLVQYRALRNGIQHRHNITPVDPKPGEAVTVHIKIASQTLLENIALYYTIDGTEPDGSRGKATNGTATHFERINVEWDMILWDYVVDWQAVIPGQADGTMVQYMISAWSDKGDEIYADSPNYDDRVHYATMLHFKNITEDTPLIDLEHFPGERIFNYHVDTFKPPEWAYHANIYHIFVDSFYPGDGKEWLDSEIDDLFGFNGGTLWGVRDKLDYLADLGIDCIWLSPTWASPTKHGYDIIDYERTEPRLGGDDALKAVIDGAHARGIRVLMDMVCNHLSHEHPIFVTAKNDENSPYRDWFHFDDRVPHGYKSFFGVESMPKINLNFPAARDWMVENAVKWIREFDIDGYRLDVADGPGPNFWNYFRKACKEAKPDSLIFGEIIDIPTRLRTYAGRLDGCLDFPLTDVLRRTFGWETMTTSQLEAFITNNAIYYPDDFVAPVFLDNHDMNRFSFITGGDSHKIKRAISLQMQMPQPIIVYYGTEVGMSQDEDHVTGGFDVARKRMLWDDEQDKDLLDFYKAQIAARKQR